MKLCVGTYHVVRRCCTTNNTQAPLSVFEPALLRVLVYCEDGLHWMICDILALCSSLHEPMLVSTRLV